MQNKIDQHRKPSRYPLRATARRILRAQTHRDERIFHSRAAFLATLGISALDERVPRPEFRPPSQKLLWRTSVSSSKGPVPRS